MITNRVCEILGTEKPVVQAPMTWITSPELAAAVSNAGGFGILGFNAGFKVIYRDMYPTVASAKAAEAAGVDILVATGCDEEGGMPVESTGTIVKTALITDAVNIPVLAAGGIVNEAMAKASACVSAEGAYVGTSFVLSKECLAAQATKDDILNTEADDLQPSTGSFYAGMLKGDMDAGINTVSSAASLIRSIDSGEEIVNEIACGYSN